jgi:hypothetical protein
MKYHVYGYCDDKPDCVQTARLTTEDEFAAERQAEIWQERGYAVTIVGEPANDADVCMLKLADEFQALAEQHYGREVYDDNGRCIGRMMPASNARQKPKNAAMALMLARIYAEDNDDA